MPRTPRTRRAPVEAVSAEPTAAEPVQAVPVTEQIVPEMEQTVPAPAEPAAAPRRRTGRARRRIAPVTETEVDPAAHAFTGEAASTDAPAAPTVPAAPAESVATPPKRRQRMRRAAPAAADTPTAETQIQSPVAATSHPPTEVPAAAAPETSPAPATLWTTGRRYTIGPDGRVRYVDAVLGEPSRSEPEPTEPEDARPIEAAEAEAAPVPVAAEASEPDAEVQQTPVTEQPAVTELDGTPVEELAATNGHEAAAHRRRRRSRRGGRGRHRNGATSDHAADAAVEVEAAETEPAPTPDVQPDEPPAREHTTARGASLSPLEALVARQNVILDQLMQRQTTMARSMEQALNAVEARLKGTDLSRVSAMPRLGVFVDVPNIMYAAERYNVAVDFGKLLDHVSRDRTLIRASAYAPISDDPTQSLDLQRFVQPFVNRGYRIVTKPLQRFAAGSIKANFDVELAIDILTMADRLDIVTLVSGDGDFRHLVEIVASRGVRVEVVAFQQSTAAELKAIADSYIDLTQHLRDLCVPLEPEARLRGGRNRLD